MLCVRYWYGGCGFENRCRGFLYQWFEFLSLRQSGVTCVIRSMQWLLAESLLAFRSSDGQSGEVPEWPNGHDWKSCRQQCLAGSNPALSAIGPLAYRHFPSTSEVRHRDIAFVQVLVARCPLLKFPGHTFRVALM
jgi:hypothetical protein